MIDLFVLQDERRENAQHLGITARAGKYVMVKERVADNGALQLVSDATPVGELQVYASRPLGIFPWGQGPLLMMLAQEGISS